MEMHFPWTVVLKAVHSLTKIFLLNKELDENITQNLPAIFAFNHNNYFETFLVPAYLMHELGDRNISFVIDWMFGRLPVLKTLLRQIEPVYVYGKKAKIPFLKPSPNVAAGSIVSQCRDRLRNNRSIGIFPEGKRNHSKELLRRARTGLGQIVLLADAPVVPVGIHFPARNREKIPLIGRFELRAGKPMRFTELSDLYRQWLAAKGPEDRQNQAVLNRLAQYVSYQVMTSISSLCGKRYEYPEPDISFIQRPQGGWLCQESA